MKKSLQIAFISSAILLFSACHTTRNATTSDRGNLDSDSITGKRWRLTELYGEPVAATINGKVPFILLRDTGDRYAATAGCNGLGGTFIFSGKGGIKFSQGMSTMMACENMEIETNFKKMLGQTDNYIVNGNKLSFRKGSTSPLATFQIDSNNIVEELNGTWELDYISGLKISFEGLYPNKKPVITFNLPDSRAAGNSSCNNFNVPFTIDGSNIKFNDAASTRMFCPGAGEAAFFKTLKTVTKYIVSGNTLNLTMNDIPVMRFHKK